MLLIATGVVMLIFDITKTGRHYLTQQNSAIGGAIVIFVGVIGAVIGYYSLSPFGRVRKFFEESLEMRKRK